MRPSSCAITSLWVFAAASFSGTAAAQTPIRDFEGFMHGASITCTHTTSQLRIEVTDRALMQKVEDFLALPDARQSGVTHPRMILAGMTVTTGGPTRMGTFNAVEDATLLWFNEIKHGKEIQTRVARQKDGGFVLRHYTDSKGSLGVPRAAESPLKENLAQFKEVSVSLIQAGQKFVSETCDAVRSTIGHRTSGYGLPARTLLLPREKLDELLKKVWAKRMAEGKTRLSAPITFSSQTIGFNEPRLQPFLAGLSHLHDLYGAPDARVAMATADVPLPRPRPDRAMQALVKKARYILGWSDEAPENFDRPAKKEFQGILMERTGLKTQKGSRPDGRVGPLTAKAARKFLKMMHG